MRAAVARLGQLVVEEIDEPIPKKDEVLVASRGTGICGSDLRILESQTTPEGAAREFVLGHEFCVEVLEYGPGTPPLVPVGSLACRNPFVGNGPGFEVVGLHPSRPGAMAERFVLPTEGLLELPPGVEPTHAVLTEPLAVGIHAVAAAQARNASGPFLVVGCGPIGLAVIAALRYLGLGPIIASGRRLTRRQMAGKAGADVVIDPDETSPFSAWVDCGAVAAPPAPLRQGPHSRRPLIFDCAGGPGTLQTILEGAVPGSHIVAVGASAQPDTVIPVTALLKAVSIDFVLAYTPAEFKLALTRLGSGRMDMSGMVTSVIGLDALGDLTERVRSDDEIKVVVTPA